MKSINRLNSLDYLRGIAAFGIMIYHYSSWTFGRFHADNFMGRVGVYGVAIFYVLSGLTLFHVYHEIMKPKYFLRNYLLELLYIDGGGYSITYFIT